MVVDILVIIGLIVYFVSKSYVFEKAGEYGWKALVPFYGLFTLNKITNTKNFFIPIAITEIIFIASLIIGFRTMTSSVMLSNSMFVVMLLSAVLFTVFMIRTLISLCDIAGIKKIFSIGLYLAPPVFFGILAFNDKIQLGSNGLE